jgi:hypothetical protein
MVSCFGAGSSVSSPTRRAARRDLDSFLVFQSRPGSQFSRRRCAGFCLPPEILWSSFDSRGAVSRSEFFPPDPVSQLRPVRSGSSSAVLARDQAPFPANPTPRARLHFLLAFRRLPLAFIVSSLVSAPTPEFFLCAKVLVLGPCLKASSSIGPFLEFFLPSWSGTGSLPRLIAVLDSAPRQRLRGFWFSYCL